MKIIFCFIFKFLFAISLISAQDTYEEALLAEQDNNFIKASVLYEKILFESQDSILINKVLVAKANNYIIQKQYNEAINFITKSVYLASSPTTIYILSEKLILCYYITKQHDLALNQISISQNNDLANHDWLIFFKILNLNELTKWNEAKNEYISWLKINELDSLNIDKYNSIPKLKSEVKAGWLGLLPGLGLVYSKNYLEAMASLLLQGSFGYFAYASYVDQYYFSSWLLGIGLTGSFYLGGQRRSIELVKNYNLKKATIYNFELKQFLTNQMNNILNNKKEANKK